MANVIDVVHNLQYNLDGSGLQQATAAISRQSQQLSVQQQQLERLQRLYQQSNASDAAARTRIIGLIERQRTAIQSTTQAIGQEIAQNRRLQEVIQREVGLINGLQARYNSLKVARDAATDPRRLREYNRELERTQAQINRMSGAGSSGQIRNGILSGLGLGVGLGTFGAVATAVSAVAGFVREASRLGAEIEGVQRAFNRLNNPGLLDNLREATKGTVSDLELMKSAVQFRNFGLPVEKLADGLAFARIRAAETGQSVDYLVNSITIGIGRQSPLILDNLGINARRVREEFQKTGNFAEAAFKIIAEEGAKATGVMDTYAERIARVNTAIENMQATLGRDLNGFKTYTGLIARDFGDLFSGNIKSYDQETKSQAFLRLQVERTQAEQMRADTDARALRTQPAADRIFEENFQDLYSKYLAADKDARKDIEKQAQRMYFNLLAQGQQFSLKNNELEPFAHFFDGLEAVRLRIANWNKQPLSLKALRPQDLDQMTSEELQATQERVGLAKNSLTIGDTADIGIYAILSKNLQDRIDKINAKKPAGSDKDANKAKQIAEQRLALEANLQDRIRDLQLAGVQERLEGEEESLEKIDNLNGLALQRVEEKIDKEISEARRKGLLTEKIAAQFQKVREMSEAAAQQKLLKDREAFLMKQSQMLAELGLTATKDELNILNGELQLPGGMTLGNLTRAAQLETQVAVSEAEKRYDELAKKAKGNADAEAAIAKNREDELSLIRNQGNQKQLQAAEKYLDDLQSLNKKALEDAILNAYDQQGANQLQEDVASGRISRRRFFRGRNNISLAGQRSKINQRLGQIPGEQSEADDNVSRILGDPNATDRQIQAAQARAAALKQEVTDLNAELVELDDDVAKRQLDNFTRTVSMYSNLVNEIGQALQMIYSMQQQAYDREIRLRERRVDQAIALAERGNTEVLKIEQERLDQAEKARTEAARKQAAVNAALVISNSLVAVATTAAESGVASPAFVAATIAALVAGFAAASTLSRESDVSGSFAHGGYTGDGGKYEAAGTVHKGEFVMTKEKTQQFRPVLETMLYGKPITNTITDSGFATKGELKSLGKKMDGVKGAIEGLTFKAENRVDRNGVHQIIEAEQKVIRRQWG